MESPVSEETASCMDVGYHSTLISAADWPSNLADKDVNDTPPAQAAHDQTHTAEATTQQLSWQLLKGTAAHSQVDDKLRRFANDWCAVASADQVVVVCQQGRRRPSVRAVSGTPSFDSSSDAIGQIEQIAESLGQSSENLAWFRGGQNDTADCLLGTYCRLNGFNGGTFVPLLTSANRLVGHLGTFCSSSKLESAKLKILGNELFPLLADQIDVALKTEKSRLVRFLTNSWQQLVLGKKFFWLVAISLFTALMLFPTPHYISCDSTLEPTFRRYIASPFEGKLKESLVEPGDGVEQDQVLAVLDGDEFRLELASAEAEYDREKERQSAALQEGRVSDAQIAELEMQKLQHDIDRYRRKIANLEIRSPIRGMIVSGELKQSEGAPLKQGQPLFEVGPIDELDIELEVPEGDIRFVRKSQAVTVRFHAFPLREFAGTIESLYPRAETRSDQVVFVAKARISNAEGLLRPGMKGNASILAGNSSLGWNLFHRPVENLRSSLGL